MAKSSSSLSTKHRIIWFIILIFAVLGIISFALMPLFQAQTLQ